MFLREVKLCSSNFAKSQASRSKVNRTASVVTFLPMYIKSVPTFQAEASVFTSLPTAITAPSDCLEISVRVNARLRVIRNTVEPIMMVSPGRAAFKYLNSIPGIASSLMTSLPTWGKDLSFKSFETVK